MYIDHVLGRVRVELDAGSEIVLDAGGIDLRREGHLFTVNSRAVVGDERLVGVAGVVRQTGEVSREGVARAGAGDLRVSAACSGLPLETLRRDGHVVRIRDGGVQRGRRDANSRGSSSGNRRVGDNRTGTNLEVGDEGLVTGNRDDEVRLRADHVGAEARRLSPVYEIVAGERGGGQGDLVTSRVGATADSGTHGAVVHLDSDDIGSTGIVEENGGQVEVSSSNEGVRIVGAENGVVFINPLGEGVSRVCRGGQRDIVADGVDTSTCNRTVSRVVRACIDGHLVGTSLLADNEFIDGETELVGAVEVTQRDVDVLAGIVAQVNDGVEKARSQRPLLQHGEVGGVGVVRGGDKDTIVLGRPALVLGGGSPSDLVVAGGRDGELR